MKKIVTPKSSDWDNYWSLDETQRFTKVSWSKRRIMGILDSYLQEGDSVLDAGCGSGFFSKYFCDQGGGVTSLDYSEEALGIAQRLTSGKTQIWQADLTDPCMSHGKEGVYDLIFTDGLFEHFTDKDQDIIMQNFKKMIKQQGIIVTFVPNRWSPWELIRPFFMPGIEEKPFVMSTLRSLNNRNNLNVLEHGGINMLPFAFSPDKMLGGLWGMLLYTIARRYG